MNAVEINTKEEFLKHMRAYLMCTDMSEDVKKFGWSLYWIGLAMIAKEEKLTINKDKTGCEVTLLLKV